MDFDWDEAKSEANLRDPTRGFDFAFAALIFGGPVLAAVDDRQEYGEVRVQAIGEAEGNVLFVYTDRGDLRRIISARKANRRERKQWRSFVKA